MKIASPFIGLLIAAAITQASTVRLQWNESTETNVVGYRVYWGPASLTYDHFMEVLGRTNTTTVVSNLISAPIYFVTVRSFTDDGLESVISGEITVKNIRVTTSFQVGPSLEGPWTNLWSRENFIPASPEQAVFYRAVLDVEPPSPYLKPSTGTNYPPYYR